MLYILLLLAIITSGIMVFQLLKVKTSLTSAGHKVRGFLKFYNQNIFQPDINSSIKLWLYINAVNFLALIALVTFLTWDTDYNFFIALFPFIWHYMYFRFFLWEKSDILESK